MNIITTMKRNPKIVMSGINENRKVQLGDVIPYAVCGTNKHGKLVKYKANGWIDMVNPKGCCLTTTRGYYRNVQGKVIGYTPENAERLQRLPNGYTNAPGVSNTNRHKAIGNGWTVDIIAEAFFKNLPWATKLVLTSSSFQKKIK